MNHLALLRCVDPVDPSNAEVHDHQRAWQRYCRASLQSRHSLLGKLKLPNPESGMVAIDVDPSVHFDFLTHVTRLLSGDREAFLHERAIRFLQMKVWLLFPDEPEVVEAAGYFRAAQLLHEYALKNARLVGRGFGRSRDMSSKGLIKLLGLRSYSSLYDAIFREVGWGVVFNLISPAEVARSIESRRQEAEAVCEMVDYRFRVIDHGTDDPRRASISRGEFYRWHKHPLGKLGWRTIRQRWKNLRTSSDLVYVCDRFGFEHYLADVSTMELMKKAEPDKSQLRRFIAISKYVARTLGSPICEQLEELDVEPIRPQSNPFTAEQLSKMAEYKDQSVAMRNS